MKPFRSRLWVLAGAGLLLWAGPARGDYGPVRRVVQGTAWTLDEGELAVGIVSPLQYGVLDELTLSTHPVLDLLLTPNVTLKGKVLDQGRVAVALNASYLQTFLRSRSGEIPGSLSLWPALSVVAGSSVSLTFQAGYAMDLSPIRHGVQAGLAMNLLLGPSDLLQVSLQERWMGGNGFETPTGVVTYGHAWDQVRITVGIAAGRFPLQIASGSEVLRLPVWPVVDVWWLL